MADSDRLTNFDDGDEDEVHENQDVGENRQNMRDQVDDGHGEDESVSANFGSEVDPEDEGSVADATEVGEDDRNRYDGVQRQDYIEPVQEYLRELEDDEKREGRPEKTI
ncbi:hypothetical protein PsorP6_002926 [Peronosclerospora sorghi]|uniref:Uncharacterized protein n=1 Tax=Peronosclerospora sorghi TaxID=230839 RepID=A0ACC0VQB7_9STRA|nr:hypothetical protein PsorP6_002926 [Peronosclerospora sorghi]